MKSKTILAVIFVVLLVANAIGQDESAGEEVHQLARFMPPGALVYTEIDDLNARLGEALDAHWWDLFLKGKAYKDFAVSKLFNKLGDRMRALEEATGFGLSLDNFRALSGKRSSLALYDIGELRFLFISELPLEKVAASSLWDLRDSYEQRGEGSDRYWVKEDPYGRVALAFAFIDGRLLAGTDVLKFEQARELLLNGGDALASNDRFTNALPSDQMEGAVFVYLDQERIAATPYWRSYWVFENQDQLADINSAVLLLELGESEIREHRWLRRGTSTKREVDFAEISSTMPFAGLYQEFGVADETALRAMLSNIFGGVNEEDTENLAASFQQGKSHMCGVSVNVVDSNNGLSAAFQKVISLVCENTAEFDRDQFENAVAGVYSARLLPKGSAPFGFIERDGVRVLDLPLFDSEAPAYRVEGRIVQIASSAEAFSASGSGAYNWREKLAAQSGATSAMFLDVRESTKNLSDYFKLLTENSGWRPQSNVEFFRENVGSLFTVMEEINSVSLVRSVNDGMVRETVSYMIER